MTIESKPDFINDNEKVNMELFREFWQSIDMFEYEDIIKQNKKLFAQTAEMLSEDQKEHRTPDKQYLLDCISEAQNVALSSTLAAIKLVLFNYHSFLTNNYDIKPKNEYIELYKEIKG